MMTPRSKYFNYFDVEEGKAICKTCQTVFPYSSRVGTNSLRLHIKNRHPEIFQELDNQAWQSKQSNKVDENQNNDLYGEPSDPIDTKPSISGILNGISAFSSNSSSNSSTQKTPRKRKVTPQQFNQYNNGFPFDLTTLGLAPNTTLSGSDQMSQTASEPIYPQALLDAMAGSSDDPVCPGIDPSVKQDVETIARNLSRMEDSLFYLKTTSEIVRKWPSAKVCVFMQDLLKRAMDEDNKMRFGNE